MPVGRGEETGIPTPPDRLLATTGSGSAVVEAAYALCRCPLDIEYLDYTREGPAFTRLRELNPLGQVPTLVRSDGLVMTESAAVVLDLVDRNPTARLAPRVGDRQRGEFLRWLMFLVATIYPTFTFGDDGSRWVDGPQAKAQLRESTDRRREAAWRQVEAMARLSPWMLGESFSILDLYVAVMSHWRPRRAWFARECPRLHAVAVEASARPELEAVWERNFPGSGR